MKGSVKTCIAVCADADVRRLLGAFASIAAMSCRWRFGRGA